jgi:preprotein translocase subunit SecA
MGSELLLRVFRHYYLEEIDRQWVEHLTNMEHLRDGIGLRGYGQRDPKQEYKKEGYNIFVTMMATTSSNVATALFKVRVQKETEIERLEREDMERHQRAQASLQLAHGGELYGPDEEAQAAAALAAPPRRAPQVIMPKRETPKIDKSDPCPCGSGESFKACHGAALEDDA